MTNKCIFQHLEMTTLVHESTVNLAVLILLRNTFKVISEGLF